MTHKWSGVVVYNPGWITALSRVICGSPALVPVVSGQQNYHETCWCRRAKPLSHWPWLCWARAGYTVRQGGWSAEWSVTFPFYSLMGLPLTLRKKLKFRIGRREATSCNMKTGAEAPPPPPGDQQGIILL